VRITGDYVQPAIDASGEPLHRRGHRTFVGSAPLRETLAAALVRMLGHPESQQASTLWDPFCGSGCVVLEWAESKLRLSAGRDRHFAFEHWPIHESAAYAAWLAARQGPLATPLTAFGSDLDARALAAAAANAERCSLRAHTCWSEGDFESFADSVPRGTPIVTNPPYGVRLGDRGAAARLMHRFESLLERRVDLRPALVLWPDPARPWKPTLAWHPIAKFHNGGLRVQVLRLA
jgi:putative N6-adenine-specific DNA methylase